MSTTTTTTTKKPATRPACYTKSAWDIATFDAYKGFVAFVEGKTSGTKFIKRHAQLFKSCGVPADGSHLMTMLEYLVNFKTEDGEKVKKVSAIACLRKYFNGYWRELDKCPTKYDTKTKDPRKDTAKKGSKQGSKQATKKPVTVDDFTAIIASMSAEDRAKLVAKLAA